MQESKKCPKCGNQMEKGKGLQGYGYVTILKKGDWMGDKVIPFHCANCGYIELYNEKFVPESQTKLSATGHL